MKINKQVRLLWFGFPICVLWFIFFVSKDLPWSAEPKEMKWWELPYILSSLCIMILCVVFAGMKQDEK